MGGGGGGGNDTSKARGYTHKKGKKRKNVSVESQLCSVSMAIGPKQLPPDVGSFTAHFCPNSISSLSR